MNFLLTIPNYFLWHYGKALLDFANLWKNLVVFFYQFFSIPTLLLSLFSPWHRMNDAYSGQLTFEATVGTFIVNTIMRLVGAIVRAIFIVLGLVCIFASIVIGFVAFGLWIVMPIVWFYLFTAGFSLLLS